MVKLEIEKKDFGFRIRIDGELYFIKDNKDGWFELIIETRDMEITDIVNDKYENIGVSNLEELLCKLVTNPSETLEMLIGEKINVEKISVEFN